MAKPILIKQLASLFGFEDGVGDVLEMLLTIESKTVSCLLLEDELETDRLSHSLNLGPALVGPASVLGAVTW
jgi:hypothetical protein